jgi:hypothetical protein
MLLARHWPGYFRKKPIRGDPGLADGILRNEALTAKARSPQEMKMAADERR